MLMLCTWLNSSKLFFSFLILYVPYNTKEVRQAYISEHNDERNNQVNLLMITDGTSN